MSNIRTAGIIAEYNPFHNGHEYHINETRKSGATHIVAVMSGNFVQRGEASVYDKFSRAEAALKCGADLVAELPAPWAMSTAETFAYGGVYILNAMGCVDTLNFGCECGDIKLLKKAAEAVMSREADGLTASLLQGGATYASCRQKAVKTLFGEEISGVLGSPNNILAVEYLKALKRLDSLIAPYPVLRRGAAHDGEISGGGIQSASYLRQLILSGNSEQAGKYMPDGAKNLLEKPIADIKRLERHVLAVLRTAEPADLLEFPDVSEGLEFRIIRAAADAGSLEELYEKIKTKRYTMSRIRRVVLSAALGLAKGLTAEPPPYIRVLGMNGGGRELLNVMKSTAAIPVITRYSQLKSLDTRAQNVFKSENRACDIFGLAADPVLPAGLNMENRFYFMQDTDEFVQTLAGNGSKPLRNQQHGGMV